MHARENQSNREQTFQLISIQIKCCYLCLLAPFWWCKQYRGRCVPFNRYVNQSTDSIFNIFLLRNHKDISLFLSFARIQCDTKCWCVRTHIPKIPIEIDSIQLKKKICLCCSLHQCKHKILFIPNMHGVGRQQKQPNVFPVFKGQNKNHLILTMPSLRFLFFATFFSYVNHAFVWFQWVFLSGESASIHMICN